ncbi:cyclic nucleotide-binding domain-containing protein [Patescibacteria group bacterium]|nr:MAG: cyclic nucleotide-binding domain-containing protein [Patescibacteria group bacterium]
MTTDRKPSPLPAAGGLAGISTKTVFTPKMIERMRLDGKTQVLLPGATLWEVGQKAARTYHLVHGTLAVIVDNTPVAEINEGQLVGELEMLFNEPYASTVRSVTDAELIVFSKAEFQLMLRNTEAGYTVIRLFAERVRAAHRALAGRTARVVSLEQDIRDLATRQHQELEEKKREFDDLGERLLVAEKQVEEAERMRQAYDMNLQVADARILLLEQALRAANLEVTRDGVTSRIFPRPIDASLEAEISAELDALTPPPLPPPLPVARIGLTRVAVPRPNTPVFTEEGPPTDVTPVAPDSEMLAAVEGPLESDTGKVAVPPPIRRREPVPVGARTQNMVAFDPDAPRMEITIDENGARVTSPPAVPDLDRETDSLIAEILHITPDTTPKK